MKMFKSKKDEEYTIIIGCGRLGANLADTLSEVGCNVLIMDQDQESFRKLSPRFGGLSVEGDGIDLDALQDAGIEKASAVIAVTNNDNINIMAAQIARDIFHVESVIARLYDPERECVYREFGIETICPALLSAKEVDKLLSNMPQQKHIRKEALA